MNIIRQLILLLRVKIVYITNFRQTTQCLSRGGQSWHQSLGESQGAADDDAGLAIAQESRFANTTEDIQSVQSGYLELWEEKPEGVDGRFSCAKMHPNLYDWTHDKDSIFVKL